jgi:hypothetical protein
MVQTHAVYHLSNRTIASKTAKSVVALDALSISAIWSKSRVMTTFAPVRCRVVLEPWQPAGEMISSLGLIIASQSLAAGLLAACSKLGRVPL